MKRTIYREESEVSMGQSLVLYPKELYTAKLQTPMFELNSWLWSVLTPRCVLSRYFILSLVASNVLHDHVVHKQAVLQTP